jgi:signal transduction histidine kinase
MTAMPNSPVRPASPARPERSPTEGRAESKGQGDALAILVVDDEPKTLVVSTDILSLEGYRVETARDGREALEKFEPGRFAAVVTDIRMPGLGGMELVERIRARDAAVPIVLLTGYATVETATRAVSAGASDYLLKPIDFDKLKLTLRRAVERHRLEDENRRLLGELRAANAEQRELLENLGRAIPTGVAVVGPGLELVSANAAFARLRGAGQELLGLLAGDLAAVAAGAPALRKDVVVDDLDEGASWALKVSVGPLARGRVLIVADDVTDAVRVEDELVQVEKLLSLGTLAGGIVHDLANPLTAILGTAELLQDAAPTPAAKADLDAILEAARYMKDVCGGLTEFARRARKGEPMTARVNDVVDRALSFARYAKKLAGIEVATRLAEGGLEVAASASELTQVLVNLVVNACDAIASSGATSGRVEVATARAGRGVRIAVSDTGPGIPDAVKESLFAPFFTTKGAGKGTGLGLYTSRRIAKRLGGSLDFTTGPGGTTFTLELPTPRV